jgi:hypothetical protein
MHNSYSVTPTGTVAVFISISQHPLLYHIYFPYLASFGSRDSVVCIAIRYGLETEKSEFESRWGPEFSLLQIVQTGSEVHPTSYPMGTGDSFPSGKSGRGIKLTTHLQLVPGSRKCESIHPLPIRLHGVVLN